MFPYRTNLSHSGNILPKCEQVAFEQKHQGTRKHVVNGVWTEEGIFFEEKKR